MTRIFFVVVVKFMTHLVFPCYRQADALRRLPSPGATAAPPGPTRSGAENA